MSTWSGFCCVVSRMEPIVLSHRHGGEVAQTAARRLKLDDEVAARGRPGPRLARPDIGVVLS